MVNKKKEKKDEKTEDTKSNNNDTNLNSSKWSGIQECEV